MGFRAYSFRLSGTGALVFFFDYDDEYMDQALGQIAEDRYISYRTILDSIDEKNY